MKCRILCWGVFLLAAAGCGQQSKETPTSEVVFSYNKLTQANEEVAGTADNVETGLLQTTASSVVVTIEDTKGGIYYFNEFVDLFGELGKQVSSPLALEPGIYRLTSFLVLDNNDVPLYVAPKADSEYAYLVSSPLPIDFEVRPDEVEKIIPEVITVDRPLESYGYTTEGFDLIETIDFYVAVFAEVNGEMAFVPASMVVTETSNSSEMLYENMLNEETNYVRVRRTAGSYDLTFSATGYKPVSMTFSADELSEYTDTPLTIVLSLETGVLVFEFPLSLGQDSTVLDSAEARTMKKTDALSTNSATTAAMQSDPVDAESPFVMVVTIAQDNDVMLYRENLALRSAVLNNGEDGWKAELNLEAGTYAVTELFVMAADPSRNGAMVPVAAVPLENSKLAAESATPLPIVVATREDEETVFSPSTVSLAANTIVDFGYSSSPLPYLYKAAVIPYYTSGSTSYCLGQAAIEVSVCPHESCSPNNYVDLCNLYSAYRGTNDYALMCPKWTEGLDTPNLTDERSPKDCKNKLPQIGLPQGYSSYRIEILVRGHAVAVETVSSDAFLDWSSTEKLPMPMAGVSVPALGINLTKIGDDEVDETLLLDKNGYRGKPSAYDPILGEYPVERLPDFVDFGTLRNENSVPGELLISNTGTAALKLSKIEIYDIDSDGIVSDAPSELFHIDSNSLTIAPAAEAVLAVTADSNFEEFNQLCGIRKAILRVTHNDPHVQIVTGSTTADIQLSIKAESDSCICLECGCFSPDAMESDKAVFSSAGVYQWDMSMCNYLQVDGFIVGGGGRGGDGGYSEPFYSGGGGGGGGAGQVVPFEHKRMTPGIYTFTIGAPGNVSTLSGPDFETTTAGHGKNGGDGGKGSVCWGGSGGAGYPAGKRGDNGLDWQTTATAGGEGGPGGDNGSPYGNGGWGGKGCSKGNNMNDNDGGDGGGAGGAVLNYLCWTCPNTTVNASKPANQTDL